MASEALRTAVHSKMSTAFGTLADLVAFTSVADERQYPASACHDAAIWVRDQFRELGFADADLFTTTDGTPSVIGHSPVVEGAPTVLLYCHYDVQPPLDDAAWTTPPFTLTERDGRWYGRGAADCKGNILAHIIALDSLRQVRTAAGESEPYPVNLVLVAEGSEETTGGLDGYVTEHVDQLRSDVVLLCDTGNVAVGAPTFTTSLRGLANVVVTVSTLTGEVHSGMFGGAAPDALAALIEVLSTLRDENGDTTIDGLDALVTDDWTGAPYPTEQFRADAGILDGVDVLGSRSVADTVWARPAVTVLGIDAPSVVGSAAAIQPSARARLNLRVPPGVDPTAAKDLLVAHLQRHVPWNAHVDIEVEGVGSPFRARTDGPAYAALSVAMRESYGVEVTTAGQGGSIPLATTLHEVLPDAEIVLMGVEEPLCRIHAPNESVDPTEIEHIALAEAIFLGGYSFGGYSTVGTA